MKTKIQSLSDLYSQDPVKACRLALRRTNGILNQSERMNKINELLGMHGVEVIRGNSYDRYWGDIVAEYCNAGDTYDTTIVWPVDSNPIVTTWGDWVEKNQNKYDII